MSEDLRFLSQNHPVSIILALISPYIHFEYTCEEKSYKEQIGAEMLNDIISEDPRVTQGIGGDNMTIMIVDLQPRSRSYRVADASPI